MRIENPTVAFATVVSNRRRERAAVTGERFRMPTRWPESMLASQPADRSALIGASARSLEADCVERTVQVIGLVGGLLADLGFHVFAIGAESRPPRLSIMVWVCGEDTDAAEGEQLAALEVPGILIGSRVDVLDRWARIESRQWATATSSSACWQTRSSN